jgi:hypothetical protein
MTPDEKFSPAELEAHRQAAARGELPSLEVLAKFVHTIRRSWLALPKSTQDKAKSRIKKPKLSEEQVDFF